MFITCSWLIVLLGPRFKSKSKVWLPLPLKIQYLTLSHSRRLSFYKSACLKPRTFKVPSLSKLNIFDLSRVYELFMTCTWLVHDLFMNNSLSVHYLWMTCSLLVQVFFSSISWIVNHFFLTCPWLIHNLLMTC